MVAFSIIFQANLIPILFRILSLKKYVQLCFGRIYQTKKSSLPEFHSLGEYRATGHSGSSST